VGWLLCLSGVAVGTSSFTSQYAIYALLAREGSLPAGEVAAWVAAWMLPIMIGLQVAYILVFPTGRLPGRRWRWLAWLNVAFVLVGVLTFAFSPGAHQGSLGPIKNPLGIEGFDVYYQAVLYTMAPLLFGTAALSVFVRLRHATEVERQQIKWFAYAAAMYAVSIVLNVINLGIDAPLWFEQGSTIFFTAVGTMIPLSIGIAILRYRLYDIDILINRTLVYGSLTVTLVALYFGVIVVLQRVLVVISSQESTLAVVASTLLIAALFNPLRHRIQNFIDRQFYRSKYDAAKTLEEFGATLRAATDLDSLKEELTGVIKETLQPAHVSLWLAPTHGKEGRE